MASDDPLLAAIDAIERAEGAVSQALSEAVEALGPARRDRAKGTSLPDIVERNLSSEGQEKRQRAATAIADYEHAVMIFRATIIRELRDEHGLTYTEIARRLKISRQMATRLYRSEGPSGTEK